MSDADEFRALADEIRAIPADFGLREYQCFLVRKTWTGDNPGDGEEVEEIIPLTVGGGANPKVKFPNQRDVALGMMSLGEILIGPLTPQYTTGQGIDRRLFDAFQVDQGVGQVIRVYAPDGADSSDYKVNYTNIDAALRITMKCTNVTMSGQQ